MRDSELSETKRTKRKKDHLEEYRKVVDASQLEHVMLVHLEFNVDPKFFTERENISLSYEIDVDDHSYNADLGQAAAFIDAAVVATIEEKSAFVCQAKYVVGYSLEEKCDPEAVATFLKRVAVFACYPYFRGVVANLDWAAGTNLPPLPVHREASPKKTEQ